MTPDSLQLQITGESDEHLVATGIAADAGEAVVPDPTVEVAGDGLIPEAAAKPVAGFEALLPVQLNTGS